MVFELFQKLHLQIYAWQNMHDIITYSTAICPFESGKYGKEEEKIQKSEYLENEKELFR